MGDLIRAERERQGLSQEALAKMVGISQPALRKIEKNITLKSRYLNEILQVLGLGFGTDVSAVKNLLDHDAIRRYYGKDLLEGIGEKLEAIQNFVDQSKKDGTIPIHTSIEHDNTQLLMSSKPVMHMPWTLPGDYKPDAYGLMISGNNFAPTCQAGDVIIINRQTPLSIGCRVLLLSSNDLGHPQATIAFLERETLDFWLLRDRENPKAGEVASRATKADWPTGHRIVAIIYGSI